MNGYCDLVIIALYNAVIYTNYIIIFKKSGKSGINNNDSSTTKETPTVHPENLQNLRKTGCNYSCSITL